MAKKPKKEKPSKTERVAKATAESIRDAYKDYLNDTEASYRGRNFEGRVPLSEPLKYQKHGKLRVLIMERLNAKGFSIIAVSVGVHDGTDSVHFIINRNDR